MAATATTADEVTHDGLSAEVVDRESHRNADMVKIRYTEGMNKGATRWAFEQDVEGL